MESRVGNYLIEIEDKYIFVFEEVINYIYLGEATPGSLTSESVWRIKRFDKNNNIFLFADSNNNFDNIWDDRGSLTYG
jgi:hypothetical protein